MPQPLPNDPTTAIRDLTQRIAQRLIEIRRDIHAHPELGFEEVRTAGIVASELTRLGIPHQTQIGKTGVVGLIEGGRPGPVLAIRADMDALPIQETSGLPWASTYPGLMHACGHDIHTTTLLGVAEVLKRPRAAACRHGEAGVPAGRGRHRRHARHDRRRRDGRAEGRYGAGLPQPPRHPRGHLRLRPRRRTGGGRPFRHRGARQVRPCGVAAHRGGPDRRRRRCWWRSSRRWCRARCRRPCRWW